MMPQRNQEKDSNNGVNLILNLGVVDPGKKISISTGKFPKNFNFFRQFYKRISSFPGKIPKILIFFLGLKKLIFQAKNVHLQLPLGKLFYFSSKVTTFEHTSLYMIRYNNISRPVHDSNDPPATLPSTPLPKISPSRPSPPPPPPPRPPPSPPPPKNGGRATLSSQDYRPWIAMEKKPFPGGKNYQGEAGLRRMKMPQEKNGENIDLKCDL